MKRQLSRSLHAVVLLLISSLLPAAKVANKSVPITIEVKDASGAPIERATVEIKPVSAAGTKTVVTDIKGSAQLELDAGDYDAIVTARGFRTLHSHITVNSGESRKIEFTLNVGGCSPCPIVPEPPQKKIL